MKSQNLLRCLLGAALVSVPVQASELYLMDIINFQSSGAKINSASVESRSTYYSSDTGVTLFYQNTPGQAFPNNAEHYPQQELMFGSASKRSSQNAQIQVSVDPTLHDVNDACAGQLQYQNVAIALVQGANKIQLGEIKVTASPSDKILTCQSSSHIFSSSIPSSGYISVPVDLAKFQINFMAPNINPCHSTLRWGGDGTFNFRMITTYSVQQDISLSSGAASISSSSDSDGSEFSGANAEQDCETAVKNEFGK